MLSVQVHPPDSKANLIPKGETGKTEAWVILEAEAGSRIYAGLRPGTTAEDLRALSKQSVDNFLASFTPSRGQGVLIEAGVVHSLGDGVVVLEVQENSDVTFRLYDWNHIDPKTGHPRAHFRLWRLQGAAPFIVGAADEPRVLVCLEGVGNLEYDGAEFAMEKGAVVLLPAAVGACRFRPERSVTLLEIAVPVQP
jgi:mannose-6-phosphate isomerase